MRRILEATIIAHFISALDTSAAVLKGAEIDAANIDDGQYLDGLREIIHNLDFLSDEMCVKMKAMLNDDEFVGTIK